MLHRKTLKNQQPKQTEEQRFQCATCGKMYNTWAQLVQHSRIHLGQYKCPLCDYSFNRQSNLVTHIKRHRTEQGFTCRVCLETFSNRGELIIHRRLVLQWIIKGSVGAAADLKFTPPCNYPHNPTIISVLKFQKQYVVLFYTSNTTEYHTWTQTHVGVFIFIILIKSQLMDSECLIKMRSTISTL